MKYNRKLWTNWTRQLKFIVQDSIDEELGKIVPRDDPRFMEMRKMNPVTFMGGGKVWKSSTKPHALCPPRWERRK